MLVLLSASAKFPGKRLRCSLPHIAAAVAVVVAVAAAQTIISVAVVGGYRFTWNWDWALAALLLLLLRPKISCTAKIMYTPPYTHTESCAGALCLLPWARRVKTYFQ